MAQRTHLCSIIKYKPLLDKDGMGLVQRGKKKSLSPPRFLDEGKLYYELSLDRLTSRYCYILLQTSLQKRETDSSTISLQCHVSQWSIDQADQHKVTKCFIEFFIKEIPLTLHKSDFMPLISVYIP